MSPEKAIAALQDVFSSPIEHVATHRLLRLLVSPAEHRGYATVILDVFDDARLLDAKEQVVAVLPERTETAIDDTRYRAFAFGVRQAASRCDTEAVLPHDLFLVNLLRLPMVQHPAEFAEAILSREVRARLLAPLEVGDYGREHDLPPITEAANLGPLWSLIEGGAGIEEAERAARELVAQDRADAIPYLLCLLGEWQERMWQTGGLSWISDDERNVDVVLARILEPLLRKASSPDEQRQLATLEATGMFDQDHESMMFEWMYES
ncbi:Hypothetical protein A7982_08105 [Minicystis rosea]|nr:Hypothetical protein A7982_08105 [Minicystis rosea]